MTYIQLYGILFSYLILIIIRQNYLAYRWDSKTYDCSEAARRTGNDGSPKTWASASALQNLSLIIRSPEPEPHHQISRTWHSPPELQNMSFIPDLKKLSLTSDIQNLSLTSILQNFGLYPDLKNLSLPSYFQNLSIFPHLQNLSLTPRSVEL